MRPARPDASAVPSQCVRLLFIPVAPFLGHIFTQGNVFKLVVRGAAGLKYPAPLFCDSSLEEWRCLAGEAGVGNDTLVASRAKRKNFAACSIFQSFFQLLNPLHCSWWSMTWILCLPLARLHRLRPVTLFNACTSERWRSYRMVPTPAALSS